MASQTSVNFYNLMQSFLSILIVDGSIATPGLRTRTSWYSHYLVYHAVLQIKSILGMPASLIYYSISLCMLSCKMI